MMGLELVSTVIVAMATLSGGIVRSAEMARFCVSTAPPFVTQIWPSNHAASVTASFVTVIVYVDMALSPLKRSRVSGVTDLSIVQWKVRVKCGAIDTVELSVVPLCPTGPAAAGCASIPRLRHSASRIIANRMIFVFVLNMLLSPLNNDECTCMTQI